MNTFYQLTTLVIAVVALISPILTTYFQNRNKIRIKLIEAEITNLTKQIEIKQEAISKLSSAYGTTISGTVLSNKDLTNLFQALMQCTQYVNADSRKFILSFNGKSAEARQNLSDNINKILTLLVESVHRDQQRLESLIDELMPKNVLRKVHSKAKRK
ncbi:hypothetical protein ACLUW3_01155 [Limosilactobacillus reuteri subsp. suis]|uniref:hypothetical protein n=1 Tax=Limosilactobacillus reuteri TaxID=1598 RepID=UPI00399440A0